jgi:hypothetical protein
MTPYDDTGHPHDDKGFYTLTRWKKTWLMGLMLAAIRQV